MTYQLTLTTEDGEVLEQWTIGNTDDCDLVHPLTVAGRVVLANDINAEIKKHEEGAK